jgi:hypothetical protein
LKSTTPYILLVVLYSCVLIILFFYLNEFAFTLAGYNRNLIGAGSTESHLAYQAVWPYKKAFLIFTIILSVVVFAYSISIKKNKGIYRNIAFFFIGLSLLVVILISLAAGIPHRVV